MNYKRLHDRIITHFQNKHGIHEYGKGRPDGLLFNHHHIIPRHVFKSTGKPVDNSPSNLVWLPYRWHRLVHKLLYKIYGDLNDKISYSNMYGLTEEAKLASATAGGFAIRGRIDSEETRHRKSKPKTAEHNRKVSEALKGNTNGRYRKGCTALHASKSNNTWLVDIETGEVRKKSSWIGKGLYSIRKEYLQVTQVASGKGT